MKVELLIEWLEARGKATFREIAAAGFRGVFSGGARDRLLETGCIKQVEVDNPNSDEPRQRVRISEYHYVKPYVRRKSGRKPGYKIPRDKLEQQLVRHAMSVLTNRGYTVTGPKAEG